MGIGLGGDTTDDACRFPARELSAGAGDKEDRGVVPPCREPFFQNLARVPMHRHKLPNHPAFGLHAGKSLAGVLVPGGVADVLSAFRNLWQINAFSPCINTSGALLKEGRELPMQPADEVQRGEEGVAEKSAEDTHRQEEALGTRDPRRAIQGQATRWDEAMDMGMMVQRLAPGMEHAEKADFST
jgi:hypothetical protein